MLARTAIGRGRCRRSNGTSAPNDGCCCRLQAQGTCSFACRGCASSQVTRSQNSRCALGDCWLARRRWQQAVRCPASHSSRRRRGRGSLQSLQETAATRTPPLPSRPSTIICYWHTVYKTNTKARAGNFVLAARCIHGSSCRAGSLGSPGGLAPLHTHRALAAEQLPAGVWGPAARSACRLCLFSSDYSNRHLIHAARSTLAVACKV